VPVNDVVRIVYIDPIKFTAVSRGNSEVYGYVYLHRSAVKFTLS